MLERNSLVFDGEALLSDLKKTIKKIFKSDEWINTFDGNEANITTFHKAVSDKFPTIFLEIEDDSPYNITRDSNQIANHSQFLFRITIYNKESKNKKIDRETLSRRIAKEIIFVLQKEYGFSHEYNNFIPNEDESIARRVISYRPIIDNRTNAIYIQ